MPNLSQFGFRKTLRLVFLIAGVFLANTINALADWRQDIGVFRIGIVTTDDVTGTLARIEPFRLAISEALEMDVEFFPTSNSRFLIDALVGERIEYAILSSSGYALASVRCKCVEPLVIPRSTDSTDGYHIIGIVRDSNDLDLERLSALNAAMISRDSITGAAFVKFLLDKEFPTQANFDVNFQSRNTSEATQEAFAQGEYDVLFGWSSLTGDPGSGYSRGSLRQLRDKSIPISEFRIGWKSPQIPHRPHIVRKNLPGEAKNQLRDTLVNLFDRDPVAYDSIEPVFGGGFTAARNERFRALIDFLETYNKTEQVLPETDSQEVEQ